MMTSRRGRVLDVRGALACSRDQLNLGTVLTSGQSFRWRELKAGEYTGVMRNTVWTLSQTDELLLYRVHGTRLTLAEPADNREQERSAMPSFSQAVDSKRHSRLSLRRSSEVGNVKSLPEKSLKTEELEFDAKPLLDDAKPLLADAKPLRDDSRPEGEMNDVFESLLRDYCQLDVDLEALYCHWADVDPRFRATRSTLPRGVRLLRQDPVETLFAFICSCNNNISRISGMVERMCALFGDVITEVDGRAYYAFPPIMRLAEADVESSLRKSSFGYRAKYISATARALARSYDLSTSPCPQHAAISEALCLCGWRETQIEETRAALLRLPGVGPKVADCVLLMALDKRDVVPVDTHILQLAVRHYALVPPATKSLSAPVYRLIGRGFRELWGPCAGWAQAVLFASEVSKSKQADHMDGKPAKDKPMDETTGTEVMRKKVPLKATRKRKMLK